MALVKRDCERCGTSFEREVYRSQLKRGAKAAFCSPRCAAEARWAGHKRTGRATVRRPDHPLASVSGRLLEHRMILYDSIGDGTHPCHWCRVAVTWVNRTRGGASATDLVVDHLDGDEQNNALENLVPACNRCNALRGYLASWADDARRDPRILVADIARP